MRLPNHVVAAIDAAAEKGARRLDSRRPEWYRQIDTRTLDLSHGCLCVLGQLYGHFDDVSCRRVIGGWFVTPYNEAGGDLAGAYGFVLPRAARDYANEAWEAYCVSWDDTEHQRWTRRNSSLWRRLERAWKLQIAARIAEDEQKAMNEHLHDSMAAAA